jgi:hypothetical protein
MATVLTIGGVAIDRVATRTTIQSCRPYAKDGLPQLQFARAIGVPGSGVDPWDGLEVTLTQDGLLIFKGDTGGHLTHHDRGLGWVREWSCYGLAKRAEYIPVTDSVTQTDTVRFNLPGDDPDFIGSRAGRSIGQMIAAVLEMPENSAALTAVGIGRYTSAGTGAAATATVSGGSVTTIAINSAGAGYTVAPRIIFSGGDGNGAAATATVSGGAITGIAITSGGTGYRTAPAIILSRLPTETLADLDTLAIIPPFEVAIGGERILQAIEGAVQSVHPNHFLQVAHDGTIRLHDPRTWPADITLTINDASDPRVGMPSMTTDWSNCYQRCIVRGHDRVIAVSLNLSKGDLTEDFAHDGLTNTEAKAQFKAADFQDPGHPTGQAQGLAVVGSGAVTSISVQFSGYGYTSTPGVVISGGAGSGATATAVRTGDKITGFTVTAGGSGYTSAPTVLADVPGGAGQSDVGTCTCPSTTQVTLTSSNNKVTWPANYWDQTDSGRHGVLVVRSATITGYTQLYSARVVANTALVAGGTSTVTLDDALPATSYDTYQLFGVAGGASVVYRRYKVTNAAIAGRLANYFPFPMAYRNSDGSAATLTSTPVGTVFYSSAGVAPFQQSGIGISVDPVSGTILTAKPTALVFSADGMTPVPVNDVQAFLPVHSGGLSVTWPADIAGVPQYEGTSFTDLGLQRTKIISANDWRDTSNSANMTLMASEYLDSVKDIVLEGSIPYSGLLSDALAIGHRLNIAGRDFATGWESAGIPILALDLTYNERGGSTKHLTTLSFSNRRAPFSGAQFQRPAMRGQPIGAGGSLGYGDYAAGMAETIGQATEVMGMAEQFGGANPMAGFLPGEVTMPTAEDLTGLGITGRGNNLRASSSTAERIVRGGAGGFIRPETDQDIVNRIGRQDRPDRAEE